MGGLELQERLKLINPGIPMIFISAHDDGEARTRAMRAGAVDFLQKPFSGDSLLEAIATALSKG
jgi:two-component system response regulator FixJ